MIEIPDDVFEAAVRAYGGEYENDQDFREAFQVVAHHMRQEASRLVESGCTHHPLSKATADCLWQRLSERIEHLWTDKEARAPIEQLRRFPELCFYSWKVTVLRPPRVDPSKLVAYTCRTPDGLFYTLYLYKPASGWPRTGVPRM